ncbi:HK97 gp10 family phage protein [Arthrobacter sp. Alg241-R88]|uniref:HK97 gp10 family phage protein n=1 Tax=Arthrobacter sp. Alg241-R88 TaxID=2305984 RepID=UPI0013D03A8A|nr:HK97 gp10 family phage protein [Arthrobacter sp. Alg241-R88]
MAARLKLNSPGMADLLKSAGVRAELTARAQRVLAAAKADPHDDTGDYEAGLHIEQDTTDRAVVRVVSGDRKGHLMEANYGVLSRALDSAGGS